MVNVYSKIFRNKTQPKNALKWDLINGNFRYSNSGYVNAFCYSDGLDKMTYYSRRYKNSLAWHRNSKCLLLQIVS